MHRALELARVAALFLFGLALGLHFARMGYMPLDQSICFDGGWRWLSGELPFADYVAPNGFPVHALQAAFFALFGVDWFAYCLHAAVVNGLAVVLVDRLLVRLGLARAAASVFAACTAIAFYPPFGVPYMDQHAFFFSLVALVAALEAARARTARRVQLLWWCSGVALALAYLCKQIPSVFFAPLVAWIAVWSERRVFRGLWNAAKGALATLAVALAAGALLVPEFAYRVRTYWLDLPSEEGARRLGYVPDVGSVLRRFEETRVQLDLWSITAVHLLCVPSALVGLALLRRAWREREWRWGAVLGRAAAAECVLLSCLMFIALTGNDKEIGVPLVFASTGLAAAALATLGSVGGAARRWATRAAVLLLALIAARDAWTFGERVVATRKVNDMTFDAALAEASAAELPEEFAYLRWSVPKLVRYTPSDLRALRDYLRSRGGAFFLVGDASPLYGMLGQPSISPALWYHPALTFPVPHDPRFPEFEQRLLERFEARGVRTIVIEPRVWVGYRAPEGETPPARLITLDSFPRIRAAVDARRVAERDVGAFHVIELADV